MYQTTTQEILSLDKVIGRRILPSTEILPGFLQVIPVFWENPRHRKRLKVQTGLHLDSRFQKTFLLQVLGHGISHNGRFLRPFLAIW